MTECLSEGSDVAFFLEEGKCRIDGTVSNQARGAFADGASRLGWKRRLSCYTCKCPLKDLLTLFKVVFRKVGQRCTHKPMQGTWIHMDFSRHPLRDEPLCIGQVFNYQ